MVPVGSRLVCEAFASCLVAIKCMGCWLVLARDQGTDRRSPCAWNNSTTWSSCSSVQYGDSSTISEQLDLSKVRAKLTERQSDVLSLVEQHWILTDRPIEPGEVAEEMAKELGDNARQKALQVLDALANKRLVEKRIRSDRKRGKVVSFQPLKGQLPESWGSP